MRASVGQAALLEPELNLGKKGDGEDSDDDDDEGLLDDGESFRFDLKTSLLEEKSTGCSMLCAFASDLKLAFFPYVDQTAKVLLPLVSYTFNEDVRSYSASAMPPLLISAVLAFKAGQTSQEYVLGLFEAIIKEIVNAFKIEDDIRVLITLTQCLSELIESGAEVAGQVLDAQRLRIVGESCFKILTNSITRMTERESMLTFSLSLRLFCLSLSLYLLLFCLLGRHSEFENHLA